MDPPNKPLPSDCYFTAFHVARFNISHIPSHPLFSFTDSHLSCLFLSIVFFFGNIDNFYSLLWLFKPQLIGLRNIFHFHFLLFKRQSHNIDLDITSRLTARTCMAPEFFFLGAIFSPPCPGLCLQCYGPLLFGSRSCRLSISYSYGGVVNKVYKSFV